MFDDEELVGDKALLALFYSLALDVEGFRIANAAEIAEFTDPHARFPVHSHECERGTHEYECVRHECMTQALMASPYTLLNASPMASYIKPNFQYVKGNSGATSWALLNAAKARSYFRSAKYP